jgi:CRISPR/Cas system CSM-associated protein Csm3 (group 7 of RAMP superfamily)
MMELKFKVKVKPIGMATFGSVYALPLGPDVSFTRKFTIQAGKRITKYYIPGSSFKGALRSSASRIADLFGFKCCGEIDIERIEKAHERMGGVCDVCRLFGYPKSNAPSVLKVSDLELQGDVNVETVAGIRIDDSSGKVATGALFTSEKVYGVEFAGEISLSDVDVNLIGLTLLSLAELRLDRFGRRSMVDVMIEDDGQLESALKNTDWIILLNELKRWLYDEVL